MNSKLKISLSLLLFLTNQLIISQEEQGPDPPPVIDDPQPVSIDMYSIYLLLLGICFAFYIFKRNFTEK